MEKEYKTINEMILIGATGQNCGKTTLAAELIKRWYHEFPVIALKITTIQEKNGKCIRDNHRCGVCTNISENFELIEEVNKHQDKDTSILLTSGAQKVYWMKCLNSYLDEGIRFFMNQIPENAIIICESNSLRKIVDPGIFVMLKNSKNNRIKPSAQEVMDKADIITENDFQNSIKTLTERIYITKREAEIKIGII